jgi:hypothetical protein
MSLELLTQYVRVYNEHLVPVIPVDFKLHTPDNPFCYDPNCPCHEDQTLWEEVYTFLCEGLFTPQEAEDFLWGKMV